MSLESTDFPSTASVSSDSGSDGLTNAGATTGATNMPSVPSGERFVDDLERLNHRFNFSKITYFPPVLRPESLHHLRLVC